MTATWAAIVIGAWTLGFPLCALLLSWALERFVPRKEMRHDHNLTLVPKPTSSRQQQRRNT